MNDPNVTLMPVNGDRPGLLLVDPDEAWGRLAKALDGRGFHVEAVRRALDAIQLANRRPPRYAVVSLHLPDGSGLRLLADLLRIDAGMRIVMVTEYPSIRTAVEAIKLGAVYYLAKPATAEQLVAALHRDEGDVDAPLGERPMSINRLTWEYISHVLHRNNGNVSATARALSIDRRTLQRKLRKRPARA